MSLVGNITLLGEETGRAKGSRRTQVAIWSSQTSGYKFEYKGRFLNKVPNNDFLALDWVILRVWNLHRRTKLPSTSSWAIFPCQASLDKPFLVLGLPGEQCWVGERHCVEARTCSLWGSRDATVSLWLCAFLEQNIFENIKCGPHRHHTTLNFSKKKNLKIF